MNKSISEHLSSYERQYKKYYSLIRKVNREIISYNDLLREIDPNEIDRLKTLCVDDYVNALKASSNKKLIYIEWIKTAASDDNLYLLDVLILVLDEVADINYNEIYLYLLNYLVVFFEKSEDDDNVIHAKHLFESILDILERGNEECIEILEKIFSLGKPPEWYKDFYLQIMKLTLRAPVNEKIFSTVKKGLSITTTSDIKEFLEEYLEDE